MVKRISYWTPDPEGLIHRLLTQRYRQLAGRSGERARLRRGQSLIIVYADGLIGLAGADLDAGHTALAAAVGRTPFPVAPRTGGEL
jgi:hypothetical protein